jgi:hypothetical protein
MRLLLVFGMLLATPAFAQTFTVPQCEEMAAETDALTQKYLALTNPDADAEGQLAEETDAFENFCIEPYGCDAFSADTGQFRGKPEFFRQAFAKLRSACKK